ncbi:MAG: division plane positioning ATPase MipZ [Rhodospirillaceae bacterium]|nr:division plane positioning ATPase MipZ [Rhodospirillaceae bacterium]
MSARIVVFGNEKGGTGKSTLAMHLIAALLHQGRRVGTLDLDARQGTLSRYIANRRRTREAGADVPLPVHLAVMPDQDAAAVAEALAQLAGNDVIVIDTPGHDSALSQVGHTYADILVTPINDSLVDFDVLAMVDPVKLTVARPSHYSERVWKAKQLRAKRDGGSVDWVVVRNRLGQLDARNKRQVAKLTAELARRIGFRTADGIHERVIYRELFLEGLTAEDLAFLSRRNTAAMSHVAARQEMRSLMMALGLSEAAPKAAE